MLTSNGKPGFVLQMLAGSARELRHTMDNSMAGPIISSFGERIFAGVFLSTLNCLTNTFPDGKLGGPTKLVFTLQETNGGVLIKQNS